MNQYKIIFIGRLNGAIGITYKITKEISAESEEAATLKLYESYEHIRVISITKL